MSQKVWIVEINLNHGALSDFFKNSYSIDYLLFICCFD